MKKKITLVSLVAIFVALLTLSVPPQAVAFVKAVQW